MNRKHIFLFGILLAGMSMTTCCERNASDLCSEEMLNAEVIEARTDIEFTICDAGRLPKELLALIEQKKAAPFRLSFVTRDYMYIAVGYGAQQRGGCAVTVNELYVENGSLHIDTNLVGVEHSEFHMDEITYPYVVVRCKNQEQSIVYE